MIGQIENAILARLRAASDSNQLGYSFRTLETFPTEWDDLLKEKGEWTSPAAWAGYAGSGVPARGDGFQVRYPANFFVVVAAESARNETARRHGGKNAAGQPIPSEPGSYQLIVDAIGVLAYSSLGLDIDILLPGAIREVRRTALMKQRNVSLYAVEFSTAFTVQLVLDAAADAPVPFTDFHVNWDIPPFGNVDGDPDTAGVQIPADETADATDHVELPQ